jgi:hypothetical protein
MIRFVKTMANVWISTAHTLSISGPVLVKCVDGEWKEAAYLNKSEKPTAEKTCWRFQVVHIGAHYVDVDGFDPTWLNGELVSGRDMQLVSSRWVKASELPWGEPKSHHKPG